MHLSREETLFSGAQRKDQYQRILCFSWYILFFFFFFHLHLSKRRNFFFWSTRRNKNQISSLFLYGGPNYTWRNPEYISVETLPLMTIWFIDRPSRLWYIYILIDETYDEEYVFSRKKHFTRNISRQLFQYEHNVHQNLQTVLNP